MPLTFGVPRRFAVLCALLGTVTLAPVTLTVEHMIARPASKHLSIVQPRWLMLYKTRAPSRHHVVDPSCNLTGLCKNWHGAKPRSVCRASGLCIPTSYAWSANGPISKRKRTPPGGFTPAPTQDTLPVPLPASLLLLGTALLILRANTTTPRRKTPT